MHLTTFPSLSRRPHRLLGRGALLILVALTPLTLPARGPSHGGGGVSWVVNIPLDAVRVVVGGNSYYHHRGVYYQRRGDRYVIVRAPRGAHIRSLPRGYTTVVIRGRTYYRLHDVYYVRDRDRYIVVDPPEGVSVEDPFDKEIGAEADPWRVWLGDQEFQIHNGQFFKATPAGLVWVETPYDAVSKELPSWAVTKWHNDVEYFDVDGIIFRRSPDGFKVVPAPWDS